jgi:uncharacterized protein YwqG
MDDDLANLSREERVNWCPMASTKNWRLLMQIDTDDDGGMMWGDCGRLYFWMTDDALQRRAFEECWMILQCS